MEFITGRHIHRRTFLRGMGASVALPFLDAMIPAGSSSGSVAAAVNGTRLICIEEVHGTAGVSPFGLAEHLFVPETIGRDFELVPANILKPLEAHRDYMTIVSHTDTRMAEPFESREIGADHHRSSSVFLTQSHPKQTQGSDVFVGTSLDQLHAQRFGQETALPSLEVCIEGVDQGGGCAYDYSCVYSDAISWAAPNRPLPMIRDPRVVFDRLFGEGNSAADRTARRRTTRSILDWVAGEVARAKKTLGAADRMAMDQYLENIREVERRIQIVEARNTSGEQRELPEAPAGVPDSFLEHVHLMYDLQVLALQADLTRVISFKLGRDLQNRTHPESGSNKSFHESSHHGNNPEAILEHLKIATFRTSTIGYVLEKLKGTMDGDTHLLDRTAILWGSPMGDPNVHGHRRVPLVLFGRANGMLEGNLHLRAPDGTPTADVMLSLLHGLGHDDLKSFGDSTGEFSLRAPSGTPRTSSNG